MATKPMKTADEAALKPLGMGHPKEQRHPVVAILKGNMTPWLLISSIYTIYFLCSLGVPRIYWDSATMGFHIPMAFLFVLGCIWNLFHTPSHGPNFRTAHVWCGWLTNLIGFASILSGYAYVLTGQSLLPLGTKVLMLSIGAIQMALQILGLWYMRGRRWVQMHMSMMTYLFYNSGVLIAINWFPKMLTGQPLSGAAGTNWTFVSMLMGVGIANVAVKYNRRNMDLQGDF